MPTSADERKIDHDWRRRFSSTSSAGEAALSPGVSPTSTEGTFVATRNFTFPAKPHLVDARKSSATISSFGNQLGGDGLNGGLGDISDELGPFSEKALYPDRSENAAADKYINGWRKEHLAALNEPTAPAIVALPIYPAPEGTHARSFKTRLTAFGVKLSIFTALLAQIAMWVYLGERIRALQVVDAKMPRVFVTGWAFLGVEIVIALMFSESVLIFCTIICADCCSVLFCPQPFTPLSPPSRLVARSKFTPSSGSRATPTCPRWMSSSLPRVSRIKWSLIVPPQPPRWISLHTAFAFSSSTRSALATSSAASHSMRAHKIVLI